MDLDFKISVEGDDRISELERLCAWLGQEEQLRGLVAAGPVPPRPGELGALVEVLAVAVGSGGTLSVLAASLTGFLSQPRNADVRIVITGPDGRRVEIDAKRVGDVETLVRCALEQPE